MTKEKVLKATHSGILTIGNADIPCYVLENGERILSTRGVMKALGRPWRGRKYTGTEYPVFLEAKNLKPLFTKELEPVLAANIFKTDKGKLSEGYKAQLLPMVCEIYLKARDTNILTQSQMKVAIKADILMRGLAHIGIYALVDEATGYQYVRDRLALQKILEKYIAKELIKWVKTFPDEFYELLFKLKNWQYRPLTVKRPQVVGKITNDIIYDRLALGVRKELQKITPKDEKGRRIHQFHRRLTEDIGHPKLKEHISNVIILMKASASWSNFYRLLQRALPKHGDTLEIPFKEK